MPNAPAPVDPVVRDALVRELTVPGERTAEHAALLVDAMLGQPDYGMSWHNVDQRLTRIRIRDRDLLNAESRFGWVKPGGEWLGCSHAAHDMLLHYMGVEAKDAEAAGWARVGPRGPRSLYRLTPAQRREIVARRVAIDDAAERMKPRMAEGADLVAYAERAFDDPETGFKP